MYYDLFNCTYVDCGNNVCTYKNVFTYINSSCFIYLKHK